MDILIVGLTLILIIIIVPPSITTIQKRLKEKRILKGYHYKKISSKFAIISKNEKQFGIMNLDDEEILSPIMWDKITHLPNLEKYLILLKDIIFIAETDGNKFIISEKGNFFEIRSALLISAIGLIGNINILEKEKNRKFFSTDSLNLKNNAINSINNKAYEALCEISIAKSQAILIEQSIIMYKNPKEHFSHIIFTHEDCEKIMEIACNMEEDIKNLKV